MRRIRALSSFFICDAMKREAGKTYPDDGLSIEVFTSPAKLGYTELELLSHLAPLVPGEKLEWSVFWELKKLENNSSQLKREETIAWVETR